MKKLLSCLVLLLLLLPVAAQVEVDREDILRITGNMVCTCGCPPTLVRACSCHRAEEMTEEVRGLLADGKTDEEVYKFYTSQFGATVMAAPDTEGFNLVGWVFPFVAAAMGGGLVAFAYNRLRRRRDLTSDVGSSGPARRIVSDEERERLRRAVADLD